MQTSHPFPNLRLARCLGVAVVATMAACSFKGPAAPVSSPVPSPAPSPVFPLKSGNGKEDAPWLGCVDHSPADKGVTDTPRPMIGVTVTNFQKGKRPMMKVDGKRVRADWDKASGRLTYLPTEDLADGDHSVEVSWSGRGCAWLFVARLETPALEGWVLSTQATPSWPVSTPLPTPPTR